MILHTTCTRYTCTNPKEPMNHGCGSRREYSRGAEWLHGHHRRYGDVYVNQGEEYALRLHVLELPVHVEVEANFLSIFFDFFDL